MYYFSHPLVHGTHMKQGTIILYNTDLYNLILVIYVTNVNCCWQKSQNNMYAGWGSRFKGNTSISNGNLHFSAYFIDFYFAVWDKRFMSGDLSHTLNKIMPMMWHTAYCYTKLPMLSLKKAINNNENINSSPLLLVIYCQSYWLHEQLENTKIGFII